MTPQEILKTEQDVVAALKNVFDPEIPINVYDLGLIYEIEVEPDGVVKIAMTLTAPTCPVADILVENIKNEVVKAEGVERVDVTLTFDPPWDKSMITEEALLELGLL